MSRLHSLHPSHFKAWVSPAKGRRVAGDLGVLTPNTSLAKGIFSCQRGSALPIIGLSMTMLIAASGTAIDMGRAQLVQAKLASSLDAAGLAAGASVSTVNLNTETNKYMNANFPSGYMGATLTSATATLNSEGSVITLAATAQVPTTFMKVMHIDNLTVRADAEITRVQKGLELVLVMDNTGSMTQSAGGGQTKLQAAKNAATTLVNILYGNKTTVPDLWIGLVPFSQAVNIGTTRGSWTANTTFNWGSDSWGGCVEARGATNRDVTDDPPSVELFAKYFAPCNTSVNAWFGTNSSRNNCATSPAASVRYRTGFGTSTHGPNLYCPQAVTPMTQTKNTILNGITAMQAVGGTEIPTGMSWGWRMLSPRWRGLWGGEMNANSLPLDYHAPLMNKAVVLMTDGDNDITDTTYTAYGVANTGGQLGSNPLPCSGTNCTVGETRLNTRTTQICSSMKANDNIIIYTVALGTSISTNGKNILKGCASKPEYYFESPDSATLQTAFKQIGDSLSNLRVSK